MDSLHIVLVSLVVWFVFRTIYWRLKFDDAQATAEDLLNLCRHGVASFDNGAGSVMADAERVLASLPNADESLFPKADEDALPF